MHLIEARNPHQALPEVCHQLARLGFLRERPTKEAAFRGPVTVAYGQPRERVLFHPERDANPFHPFFESLWMLAGRLEDNRILQRELAGMPSGTYNRPHDRTLLKYTLRALKERPEQGLTMEDDVADFYLQRAPGGELDLTVTSESNDLAEVENFSVLQEYMACILGCEVGSYWQVSMDAHIHEAHWEVAAELEQKVKNTCPYSRLEVAPHPLMSVQPGRWHRELDLWLKRGPEGNYDDPLFSDVATPMLLAWQAHEAKNYGQARVMCSAIVASDLQRACDEWIQRRETEWNEQNA